ncbi:hypothetical protein H310_06039 [Aphanomyces invadans]|uniref:Uncharacterized protein n=1 Tax=Aphanomyces invadans TaxID=157072 RepID=A0A024U9J3_9STRA|nr:hypothetical protein H310_06039 [Aphanomyces invadans]ETW02557.1 hypothetical protein H310_06039 [Aphanomyces invadans]|eukprot:XP_008869162.1 hypothetical protein H310_06039 [Aphanomyces invadans]
MVLGTATWTDFFRAKNVLPMFTLTKTKHCSEQPQPETPCEDGPIDTRDVHGASMCGDNVTRAEQHVDELFEAAKEGMLSEVRRLCENVEVDPDSRGYMGWTAAHWAAREGHVHILEYLRHIGANLDSLDRKGDCLLHKAAANGQHHVCVWLLDNNFNVRAVNNNGMTPLDLVREKASASRDALTLQCETLLVKEGECTF